MSVCLNNMRFVLPLGALLIVACALIQQSSAAMSEAQLKQAMKTLRNMCIPKSGVSKDALDNMKEGKFDDDDRKLKCYLGCVMNMMQVVKKGKVSLSMVKNQVAKMLEPEMAKKILEAFGGCKEAEGADNCELAYAFAKCVYEADPEAFIVP